MITVAIGVGHVLPAGAEEHGDAVGFDDLVRATTLGEEALATFVEAPANPL